MDRPVLRRLMRHEGCGSLIAGAKVCVGSNILKYWKMLGTPSSMRENVIVLCSVVVIPAIQKLHQALLPDVHAVVLTSRTGSDFVCFTVSYIIYAVLLCTTV